MSILCIKKHPICPDVNMMLYIKKFVYAKSLHFVFLHTYYNTFDPIVKISEEEYTTVFPSL